MTSLQETIIETLHVRPEIDPKAEVEQRVEFLADFLKKTGMKTLVLGISGGQDSSLAGRLSQLAVEKLRQETNDQAYQFIAVRLPYGEQADESDAMMAIDQFIHPDKIMRVNIKPATDAMFDSLTTAGANISDFNKGNIKARERMIVQYAIAGEHGGAVVGTDHAAEAVTGFYTKFGDGGADITPLSGLDKRQGKVLLEYLGAPAHLYEKVPTADLEDDKPMLPDEKALGVSYQEIDDYLEGKEVSPQAATTIEGWYKKTQHKRHQPINPADTWWR
ncbi:ammonia-dependent NAD(+) synthetase [Limosilactobacillus fastidiosus]|uniref:NH(3)-dependent NAD(+) synthetase n=1 Tax=Limosilactobacillus fastidiosus TaxID=2759855 RepID=A0A7W3U063_9LACO|nr:ammonia-dependent NAD(+) synthetase [Limosilactobacillus fastidiosus]MBB1062882.1 ammonia-dependent NAD(+) synthetase [Limosilactobacillus fastidiosus]MBB1086449.1 ammonia-dependent NAD(+) synthetase [Limosilactobacillus fastidiosus]MCD7084100.1 ammonia-dependent NAD(+) synthetase [Limosilactobacillus fastidiosus]MCD7086329.1 ammonia-dependent NAD(+) synthetase [Limosilactobacillus fastidiosus]MCD7114890.1 ammonia-dependent NAD(+) synthetase [Limosilactobacillus fastidiosus]